MPFSPDNPYRGRNLVAVVIGAVAIFAIVMAGFVTLSFAGRNTDSYVSFLTLLVVSIIPSSMSAWFSFKAHGTAKGVRNDIKNGGLKDNMVEAIRETKEEKTT